MSSGDVHVGQGDLAYPPPAPPPQEGSSEAKREQAEGNRGKARRGRSPAAGPATTPLLEWVRVEEPAGPEVGRTPRPVEAPSPGPTSTRRMGRGRLLGALALAFAVVAGAASWWLARPEGRPVAMRLAVTAEKGESQVFRVHTVTSSSARFMTDWEIESEFEGILVLKARSLKGGRARMRAVLDVLRLTWNGRHVTKPPASRSKLRLRSDGNVLHQGAFDLGVPATTVDLMTTGLGPDLPSHRVRPGDTWTDRLRIGDRHARARVATESTFLRLEELGGVEAAVVHGSRTIRLWGPEGSRRGVRGRAVVDQTSWLDPKEGRVLRMTATVHWDGTTWSPEGRVPARGVDQIDMTAL